MTVREPSGLPMRYVVRVPSLRSALKSSCPVGSATTWMEGVPLMPVAGPAGTYPLCRRLPEAASTVKPDTVPSVVLPTKAYRATGRVTVSTAPALDTLRPKLSVTTTR